MFVYYEISRKKNSKANILVIYFFSVKAGEHKLVTVLTNIWKKTWGYRIWGKINLVPRVFSPGNEVGERLGSLRSDDDDKANVKKAIGFISKTTTLHVHYAFFVHVFAVTARCLISRFMEDVSKLRQDLLFLSELGYSSYEFNCRRFRLHLIK